ncbi:MAG: DUF192 domain-containing protein [Bdellovibrionales bacterium]|nr:DUF192 domain-containing protein [Bdellovibrionales bacterium]
MARVLGLILIIVTSLSSEARDLSKLYEKGHFKIGSKSFEAYIADDDGRREQGLMFIEKMPEDSGMLFVFEESRTLGFWMKNTLIPLSIAFIDSQGKVVDIQEMDVASSSMSINIPSYQSRQPAQFALEMNRGWFAKNKLKVGDKLSATSNVKSALLKRLLPTSTKQSRQ